MPQVCIWSCAAPLPQGICVCSQPMAGRLHSHVISPGPMRGVQREGGEDNILVFMRVVRHLKMYVPSLSLSPSLVFTIVLLQRCNGQRREGRGLRAIHRAWCLLKHPAILTTKCKLQKFLRLEIALQYF